MPTFSPHILRAPGRPDLVLDQTLLMGIVNVTPDSFSDGGQYDQVDQAVAHGLKLAQQGAQILDVGGESTRPGAKRIDPKEQIRRTEQVIQQLRTALDQQNRQDVWISIDTTLAPVAQRALNAGASLLNDVSAGTEDTSMLELAARSQTPICLMHMQGEPGNMQQKPIYEDVVEQVFDYLMQQAQKAKHIGVPSHQILIDPGIGFGKTLTHNLKLLAALPRLVSTDYPVLLGTSRKRLFSQIDQTAQSPHERLPGTLTTGLLAAQAKVAILRVHDVAEHVQMLRTWHAITREIPQSERVEKL